MGTDSSKNNDFETISFYDLLLDDIPDFFTFILFDFIYEVSNLLINNDKSLINFGKVFFRTALRIICRYSAIVFTLNLFYKNTDKRKKRVIRFQWLLICITIISLGIISWTLLIGFLSKDTKLKDVKLKYLDIIYPFILTFLLFIIIYSIYIYRKLKQIMKDDKIFQINSAVNLKKAKKIY